MDRRISLFLIIFLLGFSSKALSQVSDESCSKNVEEIRSRTLSSLYRVEEDFRDTLWSYRKYQRIVYGPLWKAVIQRKDRFQGAEKTAEGEMLYQRYRILANQEKLHAEGLMDAAFSDFSNLKKGLVQDEVCGLKVGGVNPVDDISLFNNCIEIWNKESKDRMKDLGDLLENIKSKETDFSQMIESHLTDNGSDHDSFDERFRDYFLDFSLKSETRFLELTRSLQERFERSWPAEKCCAVCRIDKHFHWDPVLNQVKLDPQGDFGTSGNIVNNGRLIPAFQKFDEERRKEKEDSNNAN